MTMMLGKIKYLVHHIPAPLRAAIETTVIVGATTFVATAKPLLPALVSTPSMSLTKAALVTAATAALAAAYHTAKASAKTLAAKWAAIPVEAPAAPKAPAA